MIAVSSTLTGRAANVHPVTSAVPSKAVTWQGAVLDRQRSLAITAPLQEIESNKGYIGAQHHDLRTYCLYAIDQIVLGMRAQRGERFDVVEEALSALIAQCDANITAELKGRIVAYVIDGLLNSKKRAPFVELLTVFDPGGLPRKARYEFTLIESKDIGEDAFYLIASPQAIRLYTDLLARDVTDEQVANEFLFKFLVERGEWEKAAAESVRMELLSLEHEQKIIKWIEQAQVNVRAIDWKETVIPTLREARKHVTDRLGAENSVAASLADKVMVDESLSDDDRLKLVSVGETLNNVICRHTRLAAVLMDANKRFAEAQDSQCYRPRPLTSFAALDDELLQPVLRLPMSRLARDVQSELFATFLYRPEATPLPSLIEMVDRLLRPESERREEAVDHPIDLEDAYRGAPFLSEEELNVAEQFLESITRECRLTDVINEMGAQGIGRKVQDVVVTNLLKSAGTEGSRLRVARGDGAIVSDSYSGDDLRIALRNSGDFAFPP